MSDSLFSKHKIETLAVALMMLAVPFAMTFDDDMVEEDDAIVPLLVVPIHWAITVAVGGTIAGTFVGFIAGTHSQSSDDLEREAEAKIMAQSLKDGIAQYDYSLKNYATIWSLTEEHWIRQAEITASALWKADTDYSAYTVLDSSYTYLGSAYMTANANEQMNEQFSVIESHVTSWNDSDVYKDKMVVTFTVGDNTISPADLHVKVGVNVHASQSANRVFFAGGEVWASEDCTITTDGYSIALEQGWNDVGSISDFEHSGIYTIPAGVTLFGNFLNSVGSGSVATTVGMMIGDELVEAYDGKVRYNGEICDSFKMNIVPQETANAQSVDLLQMLTDYDKLGDAIYDVMASANSSAKAVWSIYDDIGESNSFLTTLTIPTAYDGITLNAEQRKAVTVLAMDQLAEYWQDNSGKIASEYTITKDSMSLYCRGDIYTVQSNSDGTTDVVSYEDVIFTPIFYTNTHLDLGENDLNKIGFVIIWGEGQSLSSFDSSTVTDSDLVSIPSTSTLNIREMYLAGESVQSADLGARTMKYIQSSQMDDWEPVDDGSSENVLYLALIVLGAIALIVGAYNRSLLWLAAGVILMIAGLSARGLI